MWRLGDRELILILSTLCGVLSSYLIQMLLHSHITFSYHMTRPWSPNPTLHWLEVTPFHNCILSQLNQWSKQNKSDLINPSVNDKLSFMIILTGHWFFPTKFYEDNYRLTAHRHTETEILSNSGVLYQNYHSDQHIKEVIQLSPRDK